MTRKDFEFFWGGVYSQWYKHTMVIDGVAYNCAEQYMMAMKAKAFHDEESLAKIMKTKDPKEQKAIGRKIKGFDDSVWVKICRPIVYRANYYKFSDPVLQSILLKTGTKEIVEASPYDTRWGIGMDVSHPDILDKSKWNGVNWLGEAIMEVRKEFQRRQTESLPNTKESKND